MKGYFKVWGTILCTSEKKENVFSQQVKQNKLAKENAQCIPNVWT